MAYNVLSWAVDNEGIAFADGIHVDTHNTWKESKRTQLPPKTSLVGFELSNYWKGAGFLASLDNTWATGDPGLKCTDTTSVTSPGAWKYYCR